MNIYFFSGLWFDGKDVFVPDYCIITMGQGAYFTAEIKAKNLRESFRILLNLVPTEKLSLYGVYSVVNSSGKKSRRFIDAQKHSYVEVCL